MSQKHLPRRVDFTPTSDTLSQPTPDHIVMVTGETGRLVDRDSQREEHPEVALAERKDAG